MATNVKNGNTVVGSPAPAPGTASPWGAAETALTGFAGALAAVNGWAELSPKERKACFKPPAGWLQVVPGIVKMLEAHPELGLGELDPKALNDQLSFVVEGSAVEGSVARVQKGLRDTLLKSGSDLWSAVLKVYGVAQQKLSFDPGLASEIAPMADLVSKGPRKRKRANKAAKKAHPAGASAAGTEAATPPATPEPGPAPTTAK